MQPLTTAFAPSVAARLLALVCTAGAILLVLVRPMASPTLPTWFAALPAGDPSQLFATVTARTKKLQLSGEIRNAILARPGFPLRRGLAVTAGQRLQIAMALVCRAPSPCSGGVQFHLDALHDGRREPLIDRHADLESTPRWQTEWVDLGRFAGTPIELELSVSTSHPRGERAPTAVWGEPLLVGAGATQRPNVLLISIDTLRADRLGSYGYTRPISPHLDALAADGVRFATAISQAPWTTPSHMSLMTSLYPSSHRVNLSLAQQNAFLSGKGPGRALSPKRVTLAEVLRANGYRTLAMTGGATIAGALGFAQGFDVYSEQSAHLTPAVAAQIDQWLDDFGAGPFFAFLHTFEVHAPYRHLDFARSLLSPDQRQSLDQLLADAVRPDGAWIPLIQGMREYLKKNGLYRSEITSALYDGGIVFVDQFLGELFGSLRRRGLYDRTMIVVTSDHGEEFGEHDPARIYSDHCVTLYDELIHVPLIMRAPQQLQSGRVVEQQVEVIDIAPTILSVLGLPPQAEMQGSSLAPLMNGAVAAHKDWALSESTCSGPELKALRTAATKYVATFAVGDGDRSGIPGSQTGAELYDLHADPREHDDRAATSTAEAHHLRAQLEQILRDQTQRVVAAASAPMSADVSERLRALGYLP